MASDPKRLRELRDAALRYIYEHGAHMPFWSVDGDEVKRAVGATEAEMHSLTMLFLNQGLMADRGIVGMIGLSAVGQAEAERLGPAVPMRDPPSPSSIHVNASYSVIQVATGSNATQTGTVTIEQSHLTQVLDDIERELPALGLGQGELVEAKDLVSTLREPGLRAAAQRATGAALRSILTAATSVIGARLGTALAAALGIGA